MKQNSLGWVVWQGRRKLRLTQQEVCQRIQQQYSINLSRYQLAYIENNAVDIKLPQYDFVVQSLAEIWGWEITKLKEIWLLRRHAALSTTNKLKSESLTPTSRVGLLMPSI